MSDILAAKLAAVESYLRTDQPTSFAVFSVSTEPKHNVTGVGIGQKLVKGEMTGQECIRLYVERKVPPGAIPPEFMLPSSIGGVPTDVIEAGRFIADHPAVAPIEIMEGQAITTKFRPVRPGCSCGFRFTGPQSGIVMAGTLGAIVEAASKRFILSNNHVLANENQLPLGSQIFQPGLLDGGNPAADQVARLSKFVPISPTTHNLVDCAIAELTNAALADAVFLPKVGALSKVAPIAATPGMGVEKVGRTTGYTQGNVFDVQATIKVQYSFGIATFDDQVVIQGTPGSFSAGGDSGSLIVDRSSKRGTALLFAGSTAFTVGNKLDRVLSALGVTLVI